MVDLDLRSKPGDVDTLTAASRATEGASLIVEDHWPEGGLGDTVLSAFADADERPRVVKLAVTHLPGSGKPARAARPTCGIDADHIEQAARPRLVELGPQIGSARRHALSAAPRRIERRAGRCPRPLSARPAAGAHPPPVQHGSAGSTARRRNSILRA